ncbi:uncharacterized protein BROUX77_003201 [Berkeleyomyces rouxiae]|uniref:uncharacterized protein n=1 Tax=Berkeleyomyces rouxiae TaxID=2035830 RepID=UPI003B818B06
MSLHSYQASQYNRYLIPVFIGSDEKKFSLIFDTGSSGIWVLSDKASHSEKEKGYNPDESSTSSKMEGYSWEVDFGFGKSLSGPVYTDTLVLNPGSTTVVSQSQAIQVVESSSTFGDEQDIVGVMGVGFKSRSPVKPEPQPNFIDNVIDILVNKVFSLDFSNGRGGSIKFGYIDSKAYSGKIGYSPVDNTAGLWNFTIGGLISDNIPAPSGIEYAIADTASPMTLLPMSYTATYYKKIPGARYSHTYGGFVFPCFTIFPDFTFKVDDVTIVIHGHNIQYSALDEDRKLCFGSLQPSDDLGLNVIGDNAFMSSYVVFDPITLSIGWAREVMW